MIVGEVTADRNAVVRLVVSGPGGEGREVEAVLDTGFNGALTLPPDVAAALALEAVGQEQVILATGDRVVTRTYRARVRWAEASQDVLVIEAAEPLVGMALLWGYEVSIAVRAGGLVDVRAL